MLDSKNRKGATITNFLLIIGLIFVSVAALGVLRRLALSQASQVETDYTVSMAEEVKAAIEKASSYPANAEYTLKFNDAILYRANISENRITFKFTKKNITTTLYFFSAKSYIIPSAFENSGIIKIYKKDSYIYVTNMLVCNTTDDICDPGCIALRVCDPACMTADPSNVCNPYCLDTNRNGRIDLADYNGNCTPSCYSNYKKGFYDIDCVESGDGICDPDTNNIKDGICDTDCLGLNGVCDTDCNKPDLDCPSKGNGKCEQDRGESCFDYPVFSDCNCTAEKICKEDCPALSSLLDEKGCIAKTQLSSEGQECIQNCQCSQESKQLICDTRFRTNDNRCCPPDYYFDGSKCVNYKLDNKCITEAPYSETCANSPHDCTCGTSDCCPTCLSSTPNGCCPAGTAKCEKPTGPECITPGGKSETQKCDCNPECNSGLVCSPKKDDPNNKACCPSGKEWNGVKCEEQCTFTILFIQINGQIQNFESKAKEGRDVWASISPLKNCAQKVCYITDARICYLDINNAMDSARDCANNWGYAGKYTRLVGVAPGNYIAK
ncbi:MAG: hypothetical protein NTZ02_00720, partial [Candidatus Woesearchaeota archaeon]|nr:hypothetical protein [Candidatus Woesearchaeota archaeon]